MKEARQMTVLGLRFRLIDWLTSWVIGPSALDNEEVEEAETVRQPRDLLVDPEAEASKCST